MLRVFRLKIRPKIIIDSGASGLNIVVLAREKHYFSLPSIHWDLSITDLDRALIALRQNISKQIGGFLKLKPDLYFLVDACDSENYKVSLVNLFDSPYPGHVHFLLRPLAHLKSREYIPWGTIVFDVTANQSVISTIQEGAVLNCKQDDFGGLCLDKRLIAYFRRNLNLNITLTVAQYIREHYAQLDLTQPAVALPITGFEMGTGLHVTRLVTQQELHEAWEPVLQTWVRTIQHNLYQASFSMVEALRAEGIFLAGRGALLPGLDEYLACALNLSVTQLQPPLQSALVGAENWIHGFKLS
jgi:hypothetical protein